MIRVTDHALVRFLERSGALDVEQLRGLIAGSLERGRKVAEQVGSAHYAVIVDGLRYVVRDGNLITVIPDDSDGRRRRR